MIIKCKQCTVVFSVIQYACIMCCSFFQISAERQKEITSMSLAELTAALQSNEVSAAEALVSYQMAALEVHEKTNCLVEPLWEAEVSKAMVG